jgi:NAD(P)-dependent dehydrogenase (short-subunit alcohol dehydrogenase family)
VLINNAGVASIPEKADFSDFRSSFAQTFDVNITSVALLTTCFLPLIRLSTAGKVINVSSGRASLHNSSTGNMPPTVAVAYSISKAALNSLTIEMQKVEDAEGPQGSDVRIFAINPGHCKTSFNGFRGTKDPIDGAEVVVRIVGDEKGDYGKGRFWEFEEGVMREVPW